MIHTLHLTQGHHLGDMNYTWDDIDDRSVTISEEFTKNQKIQQILQHLYDCIS